jgi:hypothetical protein
MCSIIIHSRRKKVVKKMAPMGAKVLSLSVQRQKRTALITAGFVLETTNSPHQLWNMSRD